MSSPDLTDCEREAVASVLRTPRLSMGPQERVFEEAIKDYVGMKHAIAVSSGTAGLHLCVRAAGISDGDWVITTPFSFVASTNVILYERAVPVFVDVDPKSGNLDPAQVMEAVSALRQGGSKSRGWLPRNGTEWKGDLKALLAVDVFGQPAEYSKLESVVKEHGLQLIEDSCEALGSTYQGRSAGTYGDGAVFAFYPNKQITTAEGGVVVTNRNDWEVAIRAMRNQGRAPGDTWLSHTYLGYNYRLDELSAALGAAQMNRLDELIDKRNRVASWYQDRLASIDGVEAPHVLSATTRISWFVYVVRFDPVIDRDRVVRMLADERIPARPYFAPIHLQKYMKERFGYMDGDYPVAEDLGRRSLALPFSSVMGEEEVELVCDALNRVIGAL
ncbi:MAG: polysaccharide biosynthesis protein [Anaerolineales bacterium]|nr:polysaccharide biosynthesis protein [Anaerolineales bacterium]